MELRTLDGQLTPGGVFKIVAVGYLIGAGAIAFAGIALMEIFGASPVSADGPIVKALALLITVLLILGLQGLMLGALVVFGIWLLQRGWRLPVVAGDA